MLLIVCYLLMRFIVVDLNVFFLRPLTSDLFLICYPAGILSWWGTKECAVVMETQSQTSSAAEKKKRVETIVATKSASTRADISEKAVASSTTSNGIASTLQLQPSLLITCQAQTSILYSFCLFELFFLNTMYRFSFFFFVPTFLLKYYSKNCNDFSQV